MPFVRSRRRVVILCDFAWSSSKDSLADPHTNVVEARITTDTETSRTHEIVLLPDRYRPSRLPKSVDPKDGDSYVAPRFPTPGDRLD